MRILEALGLVRIGSSDDNFNESYIVLKTEFDWLFAVDPNADPNERPMV